uniref:Ig-like domain-containing protein n=1 Tax=Cyprinus carpio TaxID=7962 RepID=A0A8C1MDH3_CYPCA
MFYPTEKVTMKCSVDDESNKWGYEWFKNGDLLEEDENISFSGNTLSISSAKAGHSGQYTCRGKHLTRTSVTTTETEAVQLHIQDIKPKPTITKNEWFKFFYTEERVQLKCNMTGVGWEYHLYKDLKLRITNPELTIDAVSLNDAGDYYCKAQRGDFSVDSETLQVRVQKPPEPQIRSEWTEAFPGEKVSLECVIQGVPENWNYMWFKNSSKIFSSGDTNTTGNTLILSVKSSHYGAYMCQAELQGRNVTTAKSTPHLITVHGSQPTILLQQDPSHPAIYTGEQVKLTCSIQEKTSKWQYFWQKDSQQVNTDNNPIYTIQNATCSQQGNYTCQVRRGETTYTKSTILTIREPPKPNLSIESQWHMFYQTEKVTLKCSVDEESNKWGYEWFKNGGLVKRDENISFSGNTLSISSAKASHSGQYTCRGKHLTRTSVTTRETGAVQLHIQDKKPKPTITKHEWFEFFYTEERVHLKCNMTGVGWEYKWYKDLNLWIANPELTINAVSLNDAGDYYCKAQRGDFSVDSETLQVRVQKPPEPQIQSNWTEAFPGEKVSLQCVIQGVPENWNYMWFKNSSKIFSSGETNITGNTLILSVKSSHDGAYMCQAELQGRNVMTTKSTPHLITVHGSQPTILLQQDPSHPEIYTGEQVKLTCSIQEKTSKWQYFWQKDSQQVNTDNNPIYTIQNATCSQQGNYTCQVRRGEMTYTKSTILTIREPPKPNLSIESEWYMFYQTEKVTLKCSVDEESNKWGYEWFKNGGLVKRDENISFSGNTLSISSAKASHSGQYTCRGKHLTRTSVTTRETEAVQLHIQDKKPKPTITKHEWFEFFYTEERVHLKCNMTGVGWEYKWYKDLNFRITNPELTINAVSLTDAGDYYCKAQRGNFSVDSETLQVRVQTRPPAFLRMETELSDIMTGDVTLRCNVSDGRQWNYTWFMNGQELNGSSDVLKVTGNEETIKSEFKCKGINTKRPLYSALSDGSIANNIIFKRKILLAISGSLVCCIVILIIGCIVLKITRKPGVKETAPEDLLFSMTDSKNQTISPMKEYMDNRPTELEECQEKAELILDHASAVHEDGVIKDEDAPASVANGLTSFKGLCE